MTPSRVKPLLLFALMIALVAATPTRAATEHPEHSSEFGVLFGFELPDSAITAQPRTIDQLGGLFGLRGAPIVGQDFIWFIDGTAAKHNPAFGDDLNVFTARTGLEWLFPRHWNFRWFAAGSGGWMGGRQQHGLHFDRPFVSAGLGMRGYTSDRTIFRWEVRADRTLGHNGLNGEAIANAQLLLGLTWGFGSGGSGPKDADGDGVSDRRDKCPDTPAGATVDEKGCPHDSDGDGVFDGIDKCPETPAGWPVDERGCPRDTDGDRVPDGMDACPDTPAGVKVDAKGCPIDSDGDGVPDGIDTCPDTPAGTKVDAKGCPLDSDGDGVPDATDACPDTPRGTLVDTRGCPIPVEPPKPPPIVEKKQSLVLEGVNFDTDKATLKPESFPVLDKVAASLNDYPEIRVQVNGYTDSSGGAAHNMKLSEARAKAVRDFLISKGVGPDRLVAKGLGKANPIADNATPAGRAQNRRVELKRVD